MVLFTSMIGMAIYDVLPVSYSYPDDDTDTVTFVLMAMLTRWSLLCQEDPFEPVGAHDWL